MKKNSKLEVLPSDDQNSWSSRLEDHAFPQWIASNGKGLLYILLGLILMIMIGYKLMNNFSNISEADFTNAEKSYLQFENSIKEGNDALVRSTALDKLTDIIAAHPELHAKYDGLIAENLLISGEYAKANDFASLAIHRTDDENNPFYSSYAKTTLIIANKQYDQALKDTLALKEQMDTDGQAHISNPEKASFGTLLYALNLLRIGMLQQQLALKDQELKTWQEWKQLLRKSQDQTLPKYLDGQLFIGFDSLLSEGGASFANYIESRLNYLKK